MVDLIYTCTPEGQSCIHKYTNVCYQVKSGRERSHQILTVLWNFMCFMFYRGHNNWLHLDRKVLEHDFPKKAGPILLNFSVR